MLRHLLFKKWPSVQHFFIIYLQSPETITFNFFLEIISDIYFHISNNIFMLLSLNIIFWFPARQLEISLSYTSLLSFLSTSLLCNLPNLSQFLVQSSVGFYTISNYKCHLLLRNVVYYGCIFT